MIVDEPAPLDPKIVKLHEEIPKLFNEASKFVKFRVFRGKRGWKDRHYSELKWMRNWLVTVVGLAKFVKEIVDRHPPEVWDRYRRFGIKGLTEQVELNTRQQNLEVFLNKNKPPYIVKGKPDKAVKITYIDEAKPLPHEDVRGE